MMEQEKQRASATMQSNMWNSQPFAQSHQHPWHNVSSRYYNVQQTMQIQRNNLQAEGLNNAQRYHQPSSSFNNLNSGQIPYASFTSSSRQLSYSRNSPPNVTVHHVPLPTTLSRRPTENVWHDSRNAPSQQVLPTQHTDSRTSSATRFSSASSNCNASPGFEYNYRTHGEMNRSYPARTMLHSAAQTQQAHQRTRIYQNQINEVDISMAYNLNSKPVVASHRLVLSSSCSQGRSDCEQNQAAVQQRILCRPSVAYNQSTNGSSTNLNPPPPYRANINSKSKPTVEYGSTSLPENLFQPHVMPTADSPCNTSLPPSQRNTQPLHLNDSRSSQDTMSCETATAHPDSRLLRFLLENNISDLSNQNLLTNLRSVFAKRKKMLQQSSQDRTAGQVTNTNYQDSSQGQAPVSHYTVPPGQSNHETQELQRAAAQTRVSKVNGVGLQNEIPDGQTEGVITNTDNGLLFRIEAVTTLERQTTEVIANADNSLPFRIEAVGTLEGQTTEAIANTDNSMHLRIEAVRTLKGQTTEINTNNSLPFRIEGVRTLLNDNTDTHTQSSALNLTRETSIVSDNGSAMDTQQLKTDTWCTRSSNPVSSANLMSQSPRYNDHEGRSCLHYAAFDMTDVPVVDVTLKTLRELVASLEVTRTDSANEKVTNVLKCIADLYWKGNMREQLRDLQLCIKNVSDFCVSENEAVVFQQLEPQHLKLLENKTTLPLAPEKFTSLWLNVDGQPADLDKVLAEPFSDPILESILIRHKNLSCSRSLSTGNVEILDNSCANLGKDPCVSGNEESNTTSGNVPEDTSLDTSHPQLESSAEVLIPATAKMAQQNKAANSQVNEIQTHEKRLEEQEKQNEQKEVHIDSESESNNKDYVDTEENAVSKTRDLHDEPVGEDTEEAGNVVTDVHEEISEVTDDPNDLMEVTLLSISEAREIFKDDFKSDQDKRTVLPMLSNKLLNDGSQNVPSNINFTCPHVADKTSGGDLFCPSCLGETQLLNLDLDEDSSDTETSPRPLQSETLTEDQNSPVCLKSLTEAAVSMPIVDISGNTRTPADPNLLWVFKSPNAKPASSSLTKPETIAPSRNPLSKKVKLLKTTAAKDVPDAMTKKPSVHKQCLNNHRFSSFNDGQHSRAEENRTSPMKITIRLDQTRQSAYKVCKKTLAKRQQGSNVFGRTAVPRKPKRQSLKKRGTCTKQMGLNKGAKKVRFELFGSSKSNSICQSRERSASTPVYLTISANTNTSASYGGSPSAKQKVFEQWSKTFVPTQQKASHKKAQSVKSELKSRVQMLKIVVNDRTAFRENQSQKRVIDSVANDSVADAHQPKKMKSTSIEFSS